MYVHVFYYFKKGNNWVLFSSHIICHVTNLHPNKSLTFQYPADPWILTLSSFQHSETSFLGLFGSTDVSWSHSVSSSLPSLVVKDTKGRLRGTLPLSFVTANHTRRYLDPSWCGLRTWWRKTWIYFYLSEEKLSDLDCTWQEKSTLNANCWTFCLLFVSSHLCFWRKMSWDCGLKYVFSVPPALHQGNKCNLHDKEDLSRLEMVQRLAKDGCRFLQNHSKSPEKASEVGCKRLVGCMPKNCIKDTK